MAAPIVSGFNLINTVPDVLASDNDTDSGFAGSATVIQRTFQNPSFFLDTVSTGSESWFEVPFTSPQDLRGKLFYAQLQFRITADDGDANDGINGAVKIGLYSSSNTDYIYWEFKVSIFEITSILLDAENDSLSGVVVSSFNPAAVLGMRFAWTPSLNLAGLNNSAISFETGGDGRGGNHLQYSISKQAGLNLSEGESSNEANFQAIRDYLDGLEVFRNGKTGFYESFSNLIKMPASLTLGDDSPLLLSSGIKFIIFSEENLNGSLLVPSIRTLSIKTSGNNAIEDLQAQSESSAQSFDFVNASTGNPPFNRTTLASVRDAELGGSSFTLLSTSNQLGSVAGGDVLNTITLAAGAGVNYLYEWNGTATFTGSNTFSGSPNYFYSIDDSITYPATLDTTSINITGSANIRVFRTNVPAGETLTIIVPTGSGYTLAGDVQEDGAGTTLIQEPSLFFTALNLTTATFNNVRCRLSLVPGSPATINDDGTIASGGIKFYN